MSAENCVKIRLIGYPVSHSVSPAIFQAAFEAEQMTARYDSQSVPPSQLGKEVDSMVREGVRGFNVTVPHKAAVVCLLDRMDPSIKEVGAVNTVLVENGAMTGYNTDIRGFEDSLLHLGVSAPAGNSVLLTGAGGAARAAAAALARLGTARIIIANRTIERAEKLAREMAARLSGPEIIPVDIGSSALGDHAADIRLCVQATSLGIGENDPLPMNPDMLPDGCFVYDMVYGPGETAFVRAARARGLSAADGREMLLRQAACAFRIWFEREPPMEAMRKGMEEALDKTSTGK